MTNDNTAYWVNIISKSCNECHFMNYCGTYYDLHDDSSH